MNVVVTFNTSDILLSSYTSFTQPKDYDCNSNSAGWRINYLNGFLRVAIQFEKRITQRDNWHSRGTQGREQSPTMAPPMLLHLFFIISLDSLIFSSIQFLKFHDLSCSNLRKCKGC